MELTINIQFIVRFQSEPILWNAKHRHYNDYSLKHDSYNRLDTRTINGDKRTRT